METAKVIVDDAIRSNKVMMFAKTFCPYCKKAKAALNEENIDFKVMELDLRNDGDVIQDVMMNITGGRSVPRLFINGKFIGGCDTVLDLQANGKLSELVPPS